MLPLPLLLCCSLWFTPRLEAEEGVQQERSAAERAQQLADVALAVYEAGGRAIHLPLDQGHPLVAVLRAALGVGARGDLKVGAAGAVAWGEQACGCEHKACLSARIGHLEAACLRDRPRACILTHTTCLAVLSASAAAIPPLQKEMAAGREVASALLDLFLTAEETSQARC